MDENEVMAAFIRFLHDRGLLTTFADAVRDYGTDYRKASITGYVLHHLDKGRPTYTLVGSGFPWVKVRAVDWHAVSCAWETICRNELIVYTKKQQPLKFKSIW